MALSNYTDLKAAVATWLHRSDLTTEIVDFIALGESRLNKTLRLLQMETTASLSLTSGNSSVSLPSGYLEHIDLRYDADLYRPTQKSQAELSRVKSDGSGQPEYFAIGPTILFERAADQTYALTQTHYKRWDIATDSTNWLLTNAPDAYLYAALLEAGAFAKKGDVTVWAEAYGRAIKELNRLDGRTRRNSVQRVDRALVGRRSFNITRGY